MPRLTKRSLTSSTSSSVPSSDALVPETLKDGGPLPKMFVFDLDYTLWPFWVDTHVTPPLKASPAHDLCTDKFGEEFRFYEDVPGILNGLKQANILVGAASRTHAPDLARTMLRELHIAPNNPDQGKKRKAIELFDHLEIYPGSKTTHFNRLQRATGLAYEDMLFFDDEPRNRNVETLGVTMWLVRDGTSRREIDKAVMEWRKRRGYDAVSPSKQRFSHETVEEDSE